MHPIVRKVPSWQIVIQENLICFVDLEKVLRFMVLNHFMTFFYYVIGANVVNLNSRLIKAMLLHVCFAFIYRDAYVTKYHQIRSSSIRFNQISYFDLRFISIN